MAERLNTRPWSEDEDILLKQGVALYGEHDRWKDISLMIPGRTNKACRKRWLHSLQPDVKKCAWQSDEDNLLIQLYELHGPKWSIIARQIPGRTDDACSKRYKEALDPNLKKDQWSPEEDEQLIQTYKRIGGKWGQVGQDLQRSGLACRNRWRLLERKKLIRTSQNSSPSQAIIVREFSDLSSQNHIPSQNNIQILWPPYYPVEAYGTYVDRNPSHERTFREPTPETLDIPDPTVAPFQPSSSSLSSALLDPPRLQPPPPPISVVDTIESQNLSNDVERQSSLSPLSQCDGIPDFNDVTMSIDDHQTTQPGINLSNTVDSFYNFTALPDFGFYASASPISIPSEISRSLDPMQSGLWKAREPEFDFDSPYSVYDGSILTDNGDDLSSQCSTPFIVSSSMSETSSPNPVSVDLPQEQPSLKSLLFLPINAPKPPNSGPRPRKPVSRKSKPSIKITPPTRLSSMLPLSNDTNIRPYACGHPKCWIPEEGISINCFSTSGELLDHRKEEHPEEENIEKLYRCSLPGCGKSWKSINGLQYHLQISTAHFSNALSSRFSEQHTPSSIEAEIDDLKPERKYACPQPGCYKAYRQSSGLRYHVKFGHPADMPVQLSLVPPSLERQLPIKAKKLRPKPLPESALN